jgi:plastocyanin
LSRRFSIALAAGFTVSALIAPVSAHAATRDVDMGLPLKYQKTFNQKYGADVDTYFPQTVTIHAGDSVRFLPVNFHTVDFPARGQHPLGLVAPGAQKIAGANDAAGHPFWFNGQPALGFTPALLKFTFGKKLTYTGAKRVSSGLPVQDHPKPVTVRFPKTGTFTYYCSIHPGMKGTVRVVRRGRAIASAARVAKTVRRQAAADLKAAIALSRTKVPADTVSVGAHGPGGVEAYRFFPDDLTVPAGTTVHFSMAANTREIHTATIGPGDPERQPSSYLGKLAASINSPVFDPAAVYASEPAGAPGKVNPGAHGNGFWNSGVLDQSSRTPTLPSGTSATFDTPGTYQVYCLIHPFMHGTITVR